MASIKVAAVAALAAVLTLAAVPPARAAPLVAPLVALRAQYQYSYEDDAQFQPVGPTEQQRATAAAPPPPQPSPQQQQPQQQQQPTRLDSLRHGTAVTLSDTATTAAASGDNTVSTAATGTQGAAAANSRHGGVLAFAAPTFAVGVAAPSNRPSVSQLPPLSLSTLPALLTQPSPTV